jgi:adenosylcobinamide-GDP ribazoletransferase
VGPSTHGSTSPTDEAQRYSFAISAAEVDAGSRDELDGPKARVDAPAGGGLLAWLLGPLLAVQFLTVVPVLGRRTPRAREFGVAEAFFPVAGLLVGATLLAVDTLLTGIASPTVRDVLLVALLAALTGGLHLDGLIDTFDGLFAHGDRERRLEVMRDPRAGAFGVVAVVLVLALKLAVLESLSPTLRPAALLLGPCMGRWGIVAVTLIYSYAREQGSGRAFKDAVRPVHALVAGCITLAVAYLTAGWLGVGLAMLLTALVLLGAGWASRRLGGLTGDTYGATCELTEAATWLVLGLHIGSIIA